MLRPSCLPIALLLVVSGCFASHGRDGEAGTDGGSIHPPVRPDGGPTRRDAGPVRPPPPPPIDFTERCARVCDHLFECGATDPECASGCAGAGMALGTARPECGTLFLDLLGCLESVPCDELTGEEPPPECTMLIVALEDLGCTPEGMTGGGGGMSGGSGGGAGGSGGGG
jgi:hypothetical protein